MSLNTMDFKLRLFVLATAVVCCVCLPTTNQLISLNNPSLSGDNKLGIYDGKSTTIKKHPYIVSINVYSAFYCEGTIVSDSWIITSGDCVNYIPADALTIIAGSQDAVTGDKYKVKTIVPHPKYGTSAYDYEYGCVQIKGKFKFNDKVQPAKLPSQEPKVGTNLVVAGWGETAPSSEVGDSPNQALNEGNMKWLAKKVCAKTYTSAGVAWTDRMACVYNKGKTTLCQGDFGDSFIYKNVIYGQFVAGFTDGFCTSNAEPLLISDISTEVAWIKKTTGAKSEEEN